MSANDGPRKAKSSDALSLKPKRKRLMKAVRIHVYGASDVLKLEDIPTPQPGAGEVLVKIHAASINPIDYKIREGARKGALPITMGRDYSGTVESLGVDASGFSKGDAVFGLLERDRGSYAECVATKASLLAARPKNLDHAAAAAVPLAAITAWQGMVDHGGMRAGQRVLVHGGAGGVGHMAIQIAKAQGCWVATTVSGRDRDFVLGLGADQAIDYKNEKFEDQVSDIDLVYDLIGGETQTRSFAVLKPGGALISTLQEPDQQKAKEKNLRTAHYMADANGPELAEIARLIEDGKIRPHLAARFPLNEAAKAQDMLEKEHVQGKIVLTLG
jgi:NADPH:quinone reductase-like Zn-dependent oxidoreductase